MLCKKLTYKALYEIYRDPAGMDLVQKLIKQC